MRRDRPRSPPLSDAASILASYVICDAARALPDDALDALVNTLNVELASRKARLSGSNCQRARRGPTAMRCPARPSANLAAGASGEGGAAACGQLPCAHVLVWTASHPDGLMRFRVTTS